MLAIVLWFVLIKPAIESRMNLALSSLSTPIGGSQLNIFFLGARSPATVTINTKPIPIPLDQLSLEISPFSLLTLSPKVTVNSDIFGGQLKGNFSYKYSSNASVGDLSAEGIQVAKYQLANMLGITDGKISFKVEGKSIGPFSLIPTKIFFLLKGLKKPTSSKLPAFISPLGITIPAIDSGEIIAEAICGPTECKSSRFSISSSLGQANGSFSLPIDGVSPPQANITVALTQAGKKELLPYFALLNQQLLSVPEKPFIIKLTEQNHRPKLSVVPITDPL